MRTTRPTHTARRLTYRDHMLIARALLLFVLAAIAEIGGAWLICQGVREHHGLLWIGGGVIALGLYGFVATLHPDAQFGRILAALRRALRRRGRGATHYPGGTFTYRAELRPESALSARGVARGRDSEVGRAPRGPAEIGPRGGAGRPLSWQTRALGF